MYAPCFCHWFFCSNFLSFILVFCASFYPTEGGNAAIAKPFHLIHHVRVSCTVICHAISGEVLYCNASCNDTSNALLPNIQCSTNKCHVCKVPLLYPPVNVIHCHVYGQIKLCRVVSCNNIIHIIEWHANACNKMAYAVMQWNTLSCNVKSVT